ncbi:MAG: Rne/Rng family ribonuclease [Bacteroidia bacterium]|nr:Rne/Rng family ribonuclease [Bacteroidia bacterium]MDW8346082.1 Rne/Rng family ribonuclease [Bacteroidia bacterium]
MRGRRIRSFNDCNDPVLLNVNDLVLFLIYTKNVSNEIFITTADKTVQIAVLENKKLVELHQERPGGHFSVGDLYLAKIKRLKTDLNGAFLDVGYERDAFLHYTDLGPYARTIIKFFHTLRDEKRIPDLSTFEFEPEIDVKGSISDVLHKEVLLPVQIDKEPIGNKGPRLTLNYSLAGRFLVLVPFNNTLSISKKIKEFSIRKKIKQSLSTLRPNNFGIIVRTAAADADINDLQRDLKDLLKRWNTFCEKLIEAPPISRVMNEMSRTLTLIRDLLNDNYDAIVVDSKEYFDEIREYVRRISPEQEGIVKFYRGQEKLFDYAGIYKQIQASFGKQVDLTSGGYLIIEHTEAMHVIDVNSGKTQLKADTTLAENAFAMNMEAAAEIVRQLRLRDLGGIIVIDFIDMHNPKHRSQVYEFMNESLKKSRAKCNVLPISKFGLMQITRQRVRPEVQIETENDYSKKLQANSFVAEIEEMVKYLLSNKTENQVTLHLNPVTAAYFTKGIFSIQRRWFFKYKKWLKIVKDDTLTLHEYAFYNQNGQKISFET